MVASRRGGIELGYDGTSMFTEKLFFNLYAFYTVFFMYT